MSMMLKDDAVKLAAPVDLTKKLSRFSLIVPAVSLLPVSAFADVAAVTSAINDVKGDVTSIGAAVLIVIVAAAAFMWMRRAL